MTAPFTHLFAVPKNLPAALELAALANTALLSHLVDKSQEHRAFGAQPKEALTSPGTAVRSSTRISCGRQFSVVASPALCDMIPAQEAGYWIYSGSFTPGAARRYTARATTTTFAFDDPPDPSNIMTICGGSGFTHPFTLPPEGLWIPKRTPIQITQNAAAIWCAFNCIVSRFPSF